MLRALAQHALLFVLMSICVSARAEEPSPPPRRVLMHLSGGSGPYFLISKERRVPFEREDDEPASYTERDRTVIAGGHIALFLGWRVHRSLRLGGHFTFGHVAKDKSRPWISGAPATFALMGPALSYYPFQDHGPLLETRFTGGKILEAGYALAPGVEFSYVFLLRGVVQLGVGIDLHAIYTRSTSEGDFNKYFNSDWLLSPSVIVKIGL